jgi:hypothetical protein
VQTLPRDSYHARCPYESRRSGGNTQRRRSPTTGRTGSVYGERHTRNIKNTHAVIQIAMSVECLTSSQSQVGRPFIVRSLRGGTGKSCRSGLRAASGVRSGTRRRRGSLGRSDVVVGCPAVGFIALLFPPISRNARQACTPLACTHACICLQLRAVRRTFFDTSSRTFLLHSLSLVACICMTLRMSLLRTFACFGTRISRHTGAYSTSFICFTTSVPTPCAICFCAATSGV